MDKCRDALELTESRRRRPALGRPTHFRPALCVVPSPELYDELQSLPEVLRSEFPDLAVDFLATVFRKSPAKPPRCATGWVQHCRCCRDHLHNV